MRRVLKPEGTLLFSEHGAAPDPGVRKWQDRINPIWKKLAGGCNINREVPRALEEACASSLLDTTAELPPPPAPAGI